jgi:hypothetical protein
LTALAAMRRSVSSFEVAAPRATTGMHEGREIELAQDGVGEIAVRPLDQQKVVIVALAAQIGEIVLVAALALDLAGIGIERARLAEQVERDIRQRQILFQRRRMAAPFRQPVAENELIIGEPAWQRKLEKFLPSSPSSYICPTSSGMS